MLLFPTPLSLGSLNRVIKGLSLIIIGTRLSYFLFSFIVLLARDKLFNIFFLLGARNKLLNILFPNPSLILVLSNPFKLVF